MFSYDEYLKYSVVIFLTISIYIWFKKPRIFFDNEGNIKSFGVGNDKTVFYYPFILIVLSIVLYFVFYSFYLRKSLH